MAAVLATSLGATASYTRVPTSGDSPDITEATTTTIPAAAPSQPSSLLWGFIPRNIGLVDVTAALSIITLSTLFAVLGARASKRLHERGVRQAQGVLMMAIAPSLLISDHLKTSSARDTPLPYENEDNTNICKQNMSSISEFITCPATRRLAFVGTFSGLAAGFFGIGGGAVTVPALVYLLDFDYRTALATSLVGKCDVLWNS